MGGELGWSVSPQSFFRVHFRKRKICIRNAHGMLFRIRIHLGQQSKFNHQERTRAQFQIGWLYVFDELSINHALWEQGLMRQESVQSRDKFGITQEYTQEYAQTFG
jgi:hypothetical protein